MDTSLPSASTARVVPANDGARVAIRPLGSVRKPVKPVSMTPSTSASWPRAPRTSTRMTASRLDVTTPEIMLASPGDVPHPVGRGIAHPQDVERGTRVLRLRTLQGGDFTGVHFILAGLNIEDEVLALVGRLHLGTYLLVIQRLPTLDNLLAGVTWMRHRHHLLSSLTNGTVRLS